MELNSKKMGRKKKGRLGKKQLIDIKNRCSELLMLFKKKDYDYGISLLKIVREYIELKNINNLSYDLTKIASDFGRNKLWIERVLILEKATEKTNKLMKDTRISPTLVSYVLYGIRYRCPEKQDEIIDLVVQNSMNITQLHHLITRKYLSYNNGKNDEQHEPYKINYLDSFYNSLNNAKDVLEKIDIKELDETKISIVKGACENFIEKINSKFFSNR